jgi:hypothetical protein
MQENKKSPFLYAACISDDLDVKWGLIAASLSSVI